MLSNNIILLIGIGGFAYYFVREYNIIKNGPIQDKLIILLLLSVIYLYFSKEDSTRLKYSVSKFLNLPIAEKFADEIKQITEEKKESQTAETTQKKEVVISQSAKLGDTLLYGYQQCNNGKCQNSYYLLKNKSKTLDEILQYLRRMKDVAINTAQIDGLISDIESQNNLIKVEMRDLPENSTMVLGDNYELYKFKTSNYDNLVKLFDAISRQSYESNDAMYKINIIRKELSDKMEKINTDFIDGIGNGIGNKTAKHAEIIAEFGKQMRELRKSSKKPEEIDALMARFMAELNQIDEDNIFGVVNPNIINPEMTNSDLYSRDTANIDFGQ
jgi:hypothetical protein